jgi:hypothetical protein
MCSLLNLDVFICALVLLAMIFTGLRELIIAWKTGK